MIQSIRKRSIWIASSLVVLMAAGLAQAQTTVAPVDESREESELRADMRRAVDRDIDVANTALVFNNAGYTTATVRCTAFGANGARLGTRYAKIPAGGVRYLRASDLSGGRDFVGSAKCVTRARVVGSAVFLAPGSITDLDVHHAGPWDSSTIRFPLVATY